MFAERVESEWSERASQDGYWMSLRKGWTLDDVTVIHEHTRRACLSRLPECKFDLQHEAWK